MTDQPTGPLCGKCGQPMTPDTARLHPELFLHDACLPDELRPAAMPRPFGPSRLGRLFPLSPGTEGTRLFELVAAFIGVRDPLNRGLFEGPKAISLMAALARYEDGATVEEVARELQHPEDRLTPSGAEVEVWVDDPPAEAGEYDLRLPVTVHPGAYGPELIAFRKVTGAKLGYVDDTDEDGNLPGARWIHKGPLLPEPEPSDDHA